MKPSRLEDLESIRFTMSACTKDLETIIAESVKETGKVEAALAVSFRHLDQALIAVNHFLKGKPTVNQVESFATELNSGTDS